MIYGCFVSSIRAEKQNQKKPKRPWDAKGGQDSFPRGQKTDSNGRTSLRDVNGGRAILGGPLPIQSSYLACTQEYVFVTYDSL